MCRDEWYFLLKMNTTPGTVTKILNDLKWPNARERKESRTTHNNV